MQQTLQSIKTTCLKKYTQLQLLKREQLYYQSQISLNVLEQLLLQKQSISPENENNEQLQRLQDVNNG